MGETVLLSIEESVELAGSVRSCCERMATEQRVREIAYDGDGFDRELWQLLCGQLGVAAIAIPEGFDGAGYGASALGVVAHELGRALAAVPFLASAVLATGLLVDSGSAREETIAALAGGDAVAAPILVSDGGQWRRNAISITAHESGGGWTVSGTASHVLFGSVADVFVVVAEVGPEPAILLVDAESSGVSVTPERTLDGTRPMATVAFAAAPARLLRRGEGTEAVIARNADRAIAVLTAEQVGAHERVLEIATDYARTREQFGRQIGSFQAVKHRCADMLVDLEWSRSASAAALAAVDDEPAGTATELSWRASMAKAVCSEALRTASHGNLQIHGGVGFTWEASAHLYLRRARTDEVIFGSPAAHWDRLSSEAGLL